MKIFEVRLQINILHEKMCIQSTIYFLQFLWEHGEESISNKKKRKKNTSAFRFQKLSFQNFDFPTVFANFDI